jgi:hypothetical protein
MDFFSRHHVQIRFWDQLVWTGNSVPAGKDAETLWPLAPIKCRERMCVILSVLLHTLSLRCAYVTLQSI